MNLEYTNGYLDKNKHRDITAYVMIRYQELKIESMQNTLLLNEINNLLLLINDNKSDYMYEDKKKLLLIIKRSTNAVELLESINIVFKNYI
jgi:hypothetical protein